MGYYLGPVRDSPKTVRKLPTSYRTGRAAPSASRRLQRSNRLAHCEAIENIRAKVDTVGPNDGSSLSVQPDLLEELDIA